MGNCCFCQRDACREQIKNPFRLRGFYDANFITPWGLLIWRAAVAMWFFAIWLAILSHPYRGWPKFLTNQSFTLIVWYHILVTVVSIVELSYIKRLVSGDSLANEPIRWYHYALNVANEVLTSVAIVVTIVYWIFLFPDSDKSDMWANVHVHAMNSVVMVLGVVLSKQAFIPCHVWYTIATAVAYLCFALLYKAGQDNWIYGFLDTSKGSAPVFYIFPILLGVGIHYLLCIATRTRPSNVRLCCAERTYSGDEGDMLPIEMNTSQQF